MARHAAVTPAVQRHAPVAPARSAPAVAPLAALQRAVGNAAFGQYLQRSRARHLARCGGGSCGCTSCSGGGGPEHRDEAEDALADT